MATYSQLQKTPSTNKCKNNWGLLKVIAVPLLIVLICGVATPIWNWANSPLSTPVIKIADGALQGTVQYSRDGQKFWEFLGIPYAMSPIGERKFKPPIKFFPWGNVVKQFTSYPDHCAQLEFVVTGSTAGKMDCLKLNVFVNVANGVNNERRRPVIVYMHGGGFTAGGSSTYRPDFFMDYDIVLVVVNFRLGPFGFLNLQNLKSPDVAKGNMGLKDQNLALQWVKRNIANFGGNAGMVTIIGQSAGAAATHLHVISPMSRGLFHRAVMLSGTANMYWAVDNNPEDLAEEHAKAFGCTAPNVDTLFQCYNDTEWEQVVQNQNPTMEPLLPNRMFRPTIDREFLTKHPIEALKSESFPKIPVMFSVNSAEGTMRTARFDAMPELISKLDSEWLQLGQHLLLQKSPLLPRTAGKIREQYFNGKKFTDNVEGFKENLTKLFGDVAFFRPTHDAAIFHAKSGAPTYMLYYNYTSNIFPGTYPSFKAVDPNGWMPGAAKQFWFNMVDWICEYIFGGKGSRPYGVNHGEDMYQLWNLEGMTKWLAGWDEEFSRAFVKVLVDFANDTFPLTFRDVPWPTINTYLSTHNDEYSIPYMVMNNDNKPKIISEPFGKQLKFWAQLEGWR